MGSVVHRGFTERKKEAKKLWYIGLAKKFIQLFSIDGIMIIWNNQNLFFNLFHISILCVCVCARACLSVYVCCITTRISIEIIYIYIYIYMTSSKFM